VKLNIEHIHEKGVSIMPSKKLGELLRTYEFEKLQIELSSELHTDLETVNLCKVLYTGLKDVEFVPSRLKYAIITEESNVPPQKSDRIVAHAEFMANPISINELEPNEIVSAEVDLDDPELEVLFASLCLKTLCEETDEDNDEDNVDDIEKTILVSEPVFDLGEKEYDEDSLFPFKKAIEIDDSTR